MKFRFRQKQGKFQVQKLDKGKWKSRTLNPQTVWELMECPDTKGAIVSEAPKEIKEKNPLKFVESLLNEPDKEGENRTLTEEEKAKLLEWAYK